MVAGQAGYGAANTMLGRFLSRGARARERGSNASTSLVVKIIHLMRKVNNNLGMA
jgi:hypothetical protein